MWKTYSTNGHSALQKDEARILIKDQLRGVDETIKWSENDFDEFFTMLDSNGDGYISK